jgi:hypothetical protein
MTARPRSHLPTTNTEVQPTFQNSVVAKKLEISKSKYFLSKTGQNQLKPTNYKKIGPLGSVGLKKNTGFVNPGSCDNTTHSSFAPTSTHTINNAVMWCFTSPTVPWLYRWEQSPSSCYNKFYLWLHLCYDHRQLLSYHGISYNRI